MKYLKLFENFINELVTSDYYNLQKKIEKSLQSNVDSFNIEDLKPFLEKIKEVIIESVLEFHGIDRIIENLDKALDLTKGSAQEVIKDKINSVNNKIEKFKKSFTLDRCYSESEGDVFSFWTKEIFVYTGTGVENIHSYKYNVAKDRERSFLMKIVDKKAFYDLRGKKWTEGYDLYVTQYKQGGINKLNEIIEKLFRKEIEESKIAKKDAFFYIKSPMKSEDDLSKRIYDWDYTLSTLEKLFLGFLDENADDDTYSKNVSSIATKLNKIEDFIKKNDYASQFDAVDEKKPIDNDEKWYLNNRNIEPERWYLKPLEDAQKTDYEYLSNYIGRLSGFCLKNNIIPKGDVFYDFLYKFKTWLKNN